MHLQNFKRVRVCALIFIGVIISLSMLLHMYVLTMISLLTGTVSVVLIQQKRGVDERERTIREKAAQFAYAVFAPTIGIGSFLLLVPSYSGLSVFSRGEFAYIESLGMILAYLTLFLIMLYAISYHILNRKYGGGSSEE